MPSLDNYGFSRKDFRYAAKMGLSGAPYAKRHWALSKENLGNASACWGHRIIAVIEYIPLIGGIAAVIDRLSNKMKGHFSKKEVELPERISVVIPKQTKEEKIQLLVKDALMSQGFKKEKDSIEFYTQAAKLGSQEAQLYLGAYYENRSTNQSDLDEAIMWYEEALKNGNRNAADALQRLEATESPQSIQPNRIERGKLENKGLNQNPVASVQESAEEVKAPNLLCKRGLELLLEGKSEEALGYFEDAAKQNSAKAQFFIGNFYESGLGGLKKDLVKARQWYELAAKQGVALAQATLGSYYQMGLAGLALDFTKARQWYELAAKKGIVSAQFNLGYFYEKGLGGVKQDLDKARQLYELAANQGFDRAKYRLRRLQNEKVDS